MALNNIANKTLFPQASTPLSENDYLLGTQDSNKRTRTFTIGSILEKIKESTIRTYSTFNDYVPVNDDHFVFIEEDETKGDVPFLYFSHASTLYVIATAPNE